MIYLIISILASVSVSVLLKISRQKNISIPQAVAFNYPIAIVLSCIFLQPQFTTFQLTGNWYLYILLGILLPTIFVVMGKATQIVGIAKADAAQRLSLIFTLFIAFFIWNEETTLQKVAGIVIAFIALLLLLKSSENNEFKNNNGFWILPLVWLGYGVIDLIFKLIAKTADQNFGTNLTISFIIAAIVIFGWLWIQKTKFNINSLWGGIILGILNFTNIFTYIKAHQHLSENPSIVFTGMNIGVIALGALIGLLIFKEKLHTFNYIGILLAIASIVLLFI